MKTRYIYVSLVVGLLAFLVLLGSQLPRDLNALSKAENDNIQWAAFQLETEFANLAAVLAEQGDEQIDTARVRFRADIALSRSNLIASGRSGAFWAGDAKAKTLLEAIKQQEKAIIKIIDKTGPLNRADILALQQIVKETLPMARELALIGIKRGSKLAAEQRAEFSQKLRLFGLSALALIIFLLFAILSLQRAHAKAQQKDHAISATANRLKSTVAASLDGIIIANQNGEIIDFNDSATQIFGWAKDEILNKKMEDTLIPHQHRAAHVNGMKRYLQTEKPHVVDAGRIELSALRKSGEEFPIELNITTAKQDDTEIFIAYVRDISERKIAEQRLIDARDQAERTDRAKSNFLTVMSHEMRTPLNGILGVLDLLKTTKLDAQQERYVKVAAASGEILLEHVNDALDITRIETGTISLTPDVFSLKNTIMRVVDVLRSLATEKGLTINVDFSDAMDRDFYADGVRISQILTNLLGNAIKFTHDGEITVAVSGIHGPAQTETMIVVTDTGVGIPPEKLDDIFQDFVVLARSSGRQTRGDGLGLSISRKIARLMGGDLKANSTVGAGSAFTLQVPLDRPKSAIEGQPHQGTTPSKSIETVLIVEDNPINRSVLADMIAGFNGRVTQAKNGLDGLQAAEKSKFDLIIMDISMPLMDGIETTRRIRSGNGPNRDTFILGLTAHGRQEYRVKAQAAGMSGFYTKPLRLSGLKDVLQGIENTGIKANMTDHNVDLSVFNDLRNALGDDKLRQTIQTFFKEFDNEISDIRQLKRNLKNASISDRLHKIRGAAVLLGLSRLAQVVDRVSAANHENDMTAFVDNLDTLCTLRDSCAQSLKAILGKV